MIRYQLERIKDMYSGISDPDRLDGIPVVTVAQSDIDWLIEQAERVQELEEEVDRLNGALHYQLSQENIRNEENRKLKYKNKRHRKVLEFYADEENYCVRFEDDYEPILQDNGKTARQELGWEESE